MSDEGSTEALPQRTAPSPSAPPAPEETQVARSGIIQTLDARIARAPISEAIPLVRIRQELVQQNQELEDRAHKRILEKQQLLFKMGASLVAMGIGVGLVVGGFAFPGFFALGAGLYVIAPDFVMQMANRASDS